MKSVKTPHSKVGYTRHQIDMQWGVGRIKHDISIPAGTRCVFLGPQWVVDDLSWLHKQERERAAAQLKVPVSRITQMGMVGHDAEHYGITVDEKDLERIEELKS